MFRNRGHSTPSPDRTDPAQQGFLPCMDLASQDGGTGLNQSDAMKVEQIVAAARRSARFRERLFQFPKNPLDIRRDMAPDGVAPSLAKEPGAATPWAALAAYARRRDPHGGHGARLVDERRTDLQGTADLDSITKARRNEKMAIMQAIQGRMLQMFYQDIVRKLLKEAGHPGR